MTLNQLFYFQTIARYQHYRQAAAKLNISQPSLSRSMSTLEDELGIILFEKQGRNIELTKYGKVFLEHVNRILSEVSIATNHMRQLSGNAGHVDIAYVFPLADYYIPHMVRKFLQKKQNQNVDFSFNQMVTKDLISGLKSDRFDIIFSAYEEHEPDIQFVPIIHQEMVVITPIDHPLTRQDTVSLKDLERFPLIGYDQFSGLGKFTQRVYNTHSLNPNIICQSPDENAISALVAENFGIAFIANVSSIKNRNVTVLHLDDLHLEHTVYMAYMKNRYLIPAALDFIQFIKKEGCQL